MSDLSKRICRYYTKELEGQTEKTVYDLFDWEKRDVVIKDYKSGRILTELYGLEFPPIIPIAHQILLLLNISARPEFLSRTAAPDTRLRCARSYTAWWPSGLLLCSMKA